MWGFFRTKRNSYFKAQNGLTRVSLPYISSVWGFETIPVHRQQGFIQTHTTRNFTSFDFNFLLWILLDQAFDTNEKVWVNVNEFIQNMHMHFFITITRKLTNFTNEFKLDKRKLHMKMNERNLDIATWDPFECLKFILPIRTHAVLLGQGGCLWFHYLHTERRYQNAPVFLWVASEYM